MPLHGIDVANYQAALDFAAVPMDFAIIKATGGTGYINPYWKGQCDAATASNVRRQGLYHFAGDGWQGTGATAEANFFLNTIGNYAVGRVLVLDWEQDSLIRYPNWALEFINVVANRTGKLPVIYANGAALSYNLSGIRARGVQLWHAWYASDTQMNGYTPGARPAANYWGNGLMWQFTQYGRLPGYNGNLDLNRFYGDTADWDALAKGNPIGAPATVRQLLLPDILDLYDD